MRLTCRLRYAFQTKTRLFLITDYYEGGDLRSHLANGCFTEMQAAFYSAEIIIALDTLHSHHFVYRDLKPENVLLDKSGHVRVIDMGLCKYLNSDQSKWSTGGTISYLPPEVVLKKKYTFSADWWELGVLLWEMLTGKHPFDAANEKQVFDHILNKRLIKPPSMSVSISFVLVIPGCLTVTHLIYVLDYLIEILLLALV